MSLEQSNMQSGPVPRKHARFVEDFRRLFVRGLAALMPTLITLWLLIKVWDFLWENLGRYIIWFISSVWYKLGQWSILPERERQYIRWFWYEHVPEWAVKLLGVTLAIVLIYILGLFVGNLIGRTLWRLAEGLVFRIPLIRAIYPAVKQVTDFVLADKKHQFIGSRVVAVEPHANGIWSIGLVTGHGVRALDQPDREMLTVFVPSSPTAFSGYVLVVPREVVVELPLTVEQAMRLLVSGGVIDPSLASGSVRLPAAARKEPARPDFERAGAPEAPAAPGGIAAETRP